MSSTEPAAVLSPRGLERLRTRHPWIYRSDTRELPETPGIYPVRDTRGRTYGWALVNARSEISLRMLSYGEAPAGQETLLARLQAALDYRDALAPDADSYRLVHGEADGLPGLVIDRYADYLVVQNGSAALEPHLEALVDALVQRLNPKGVLARFDNRSRTLEGLETDVFVLRGEVPEEVECREADVRYFARPYSGQKTGAFLDQRLNRQRLGSVARGRAIDVFSYHGSFALHLAGKVDHLECVDVSAPALEGARKNLELNGFDRVTYTVANAFDRLRELEREGAVFDTISLDPPAFAKRRADLGNAYGAYKELNLRCLKMLAPGGYMGSASCSFHVSDADFYLMLADAARDAGRRVRIIAREGQAPDHPEVLGIPETRYLKFALLQAID
ncbi:23S rRNA (cytosine1962-C5)-methyltransferase [Deinobacterium chartae]|uniref:23S rRNA (Cytosine1962-C5)-methyltransferase n=1 Tax=Deinobacterium chartae TaxID=521158 RepID=A0A841I362_9DEIO|nr:class I SAM-dependent rRNA methyltransferase [Deinobacterium chartae]MBB6100107.1 23S rRNA (cytosine1962-C5)-methyltransferase [Deinobacterium chartae]